METGSGQQKAELLLAAAEGGASGPDLLQRRKVTGKHELTLLGDQVIHALPHCKAKTQVTTGDHL